MSPAFDVAPFALPRCPPGELRFEEPRDIAAVRILFTARVPRRLEILYLQKTWPAVRFELQREREDPAGFGWFPIDDQWNGAWRCARIRKEVRGRTAEITFRPLSEDGLPGELGGYDVTFRRTVGLRVQVPEPDMIRRTQVFTRSTPARTTVRVQLDAGRRTPGRTLRLSAYNAHVRRILPLEGVTSKGHELSLSGSGPRRFELSIAHMSPANPYSGDAGLLTLTVGRTTFTAGLQDLDRHGPIWYADLGVYLARPDQMTFAEYRRLHANVPTMLQRTASQPEQSFAGPFHGQPRPHATNYSFGCAYSPQRFWLEANGDLLLHRRNVDFLGRKPELARRVRTTGTARFFFSLERWVARGRFTDPAPVPVFNIHLRNGDLLLEEKSLCVPLMRSMSEGPLRYEDPTVALLRFRFMNAGDRPNKAALTIGYSQDSHRSRNAMLPDPGMDDYRVPRGVREKLTAVRGRVVTSTDGVEVLRAVFRAASFDSSATSAGNILLAGTLAPGESSEILLKVPFIAVETSEELAALDRLEFDQCLADVRTFWRAESRRGSQLETPIPHLNEVHSAHLAHVQLSDIAMPGNPGLINTSVGSSTYGNFANEACMILQELDQRGLAEEVEKRLAVFVRSAGTARQPGNFTDFDGSFFGAGGWECGDYNQHHGWVLWYLAEHYLFTGRRDWFAGVADAVVAGADWVFRQRRTTMAELPCSRGWERGFLPAGSLEDVTEFHYWLSTNCLTWRGTDSAARALEAFGHPQAARVRAESDAYRKDLIRGFETSREQAPLVALRDGRWVPHYPSRLYCRGRDFGWIREVLEGAVYLPISGLYDPRGGPAGEILEDYQDNLYHSPPYGYVHRLPESSIRNRGGFSIQPNLLAGLMPHLERDEIEVYLWMFFNAWVSCFREEIGGMIEHPIPELGFDNATAFKTSDEANAVMWLRAMLVYSTSRGLHLGRAIPRAWLSDGEQVSATGVRTHWGEVSARWTSRAAGGTLVLEADLKGSEHAPSIMARFRHPEKRPFVSVTVNGAPWRPLDPAREDVDLTGLSGSVRVVASYQRT